jgi:hypothetical protein
VQITARISNLGAVKPTVDFVPARRMARRVLFAFLDAVFAGSFEPAERLLIPGLERIELEAPR